MSEFCCFRCSGLQRFERIYNIRNNSLTQTGNPFSISIKYPVHFHRTGVLTLVFWREMLERCPSSEITHRVCLPGSRTPLSPSLSTAKELLPPSFYMSVLLYETYTMGSIHSFGSDPNFFFPVMASAFYSTSRFQRSFLFQFNFTLQMWKVCFFTFTWCFTCILFEVSVYGHYCGFANRDIIILYFFLSISLYFPLWPNISAFVLGLYSPPSSCWKRDLVRRI